ncbi:MAG: ABC transporter ATP-binding protein [Pseudomonadota bacterium]|nr:ABC transporter ATP-binding protein [Pseudomonadota bacterium]
MLAGLDLTLRPGERLAVTGANGVGKSTLLGLMVGLLRPAAGEVWAFGATRRSEKDFREVRIRAGLVFQDPDDQLFCPTVAEDVAFGPLNLGKTRDEALRIVNTTLERLDLADFGNRITHKLSAGEKRLVSLATVLAMEPEVLLLDEPTNALDEVSTERFTEILLQLPQTMVIISHDPHFRRKVATRILRLEQGRLLGTHPHPCS